jgi:hypothetical protein
LPSVPASIVISAEAAGDAGSVNFTAVPGKDFTAASIIAEGVTLGVFCIWTRLRSA